MPAPPDTLDLVPNDRAVADAIQWLEAISHHRNWPARLSFAATLAMDEALTNIFSYAFDNSDGTDTPAPEVKLRCTCEAGHIIVDIIDNGRPYDPSGAAPPALASSLDEAEIGGHGARLMAHYVKEMSYRRHENWNHLTLLLDSEG